MANKLDSVKGRFVIRTSIPGVTKIPGGKMTALERIAWMLEHNPRAKLIPFTKTYYNAVSELNMQSKGTLTRPPVPEWFCGHINKRWPYFEDDEDQDDGGNDLFGGLNVKGNGGGSDKYPWDKCCEMGYEPNTPGYMWCDEEKDLAAGNEDDSFLSDFTIDTVYEEAVWPEHTIGAGTEGGCVTSDVIPAKSGEWSCGGWGGGTIGGADIKIGSANISGRSKITWSYTKGQSVANSWGVNNTLVCLGLFAEGKWFSGKIDWVKVNQTTKDLKNVKCGYNGWSNGILQKATKAKVCVCHDKKKICSNWCDASI